MSSLRILGLILSLAILIFTIRKYRLNQFKKSDLLTGFVISIALFSVSLNPNIINALTDILTGKYEATNRLLSILIISNIFIVILIFRLMIRNNTTERNISDLVRALAISNFYEEYKDKEFNKKILVVIPAYNEEDNLRDLLNGMPHKIYDYDVETVVVVDGATDSTEQVAKEMGVGVIVNRINRGGGAAIQTGYQMALSKNAEIVVTMDADGQHLTEEIEKLVKPIIDNETDFTSGSRILGSQEKESNVRQVGIFIFNRLLSLLLWRKITDCSNSFRALRVFELKRLELKQDQFHTTELIIDAVKKGIRFKEVPITVLKRKYGETKKPRSLRYGWEFLKAIVTTWWRK